MKKLLLVFFIGLIIQPIQGQETKYKSFKDLTKNILFHQLKIYFKKEIFNACDIDLFPQMPTADSLVIIKAFNKQNNLFEFVFKPIANNSFELSMSPRNKNKIRKWKYNNDKLIEIIENDDGEFSRIINKYENDTLRETQFFNTKKSKFYKVEYFYKNGLLKKEVYYKGRYLNNKIKIYGYSNYSYSGNLLSSFEKTNKRGNKLKSLHFLYNEDSLLLFLTEENFKIKKIWQTRYSYDNKLLKEKYIYESHELKYVVNYSYYSNGSIKRIEFDDKQNKIIRACSFSYDTYNRIYSIIISQQSSDGGVFKFTNEYNFSYDKKSNIKSIYFLNKFGTDKVINFVYYYQSI